MTSADGFPPHTPPFQENLSLLGRAVEALADALELLEARCDAIEYNFDALMSIVDRPLPPAECIERIRQLREELL